MKDHTNLCRILIEGACTCRAKVEVVKPEPPDDLDLYEEAWE